MCHYQESQQVLHQTVCNLRNRSRELVRQFKTWRKQHAAMLLCSSFILSEEDWMKENVRESINLYRTSKQDYLKLVQKQGRGQS